ncbi:conjugal transfer protein TraH [Psittacicella hinzii]|uniref:conjugal transfer protein TraH n=1 Tax=Psittacicella hinzii TaxID=2028575 RepID=UPI001CA74D08|nr:conjugal transfer protein TraH [Psittacicella hinzii]
MGLVVGNIGGLSTQATASIDNYMRQYVLINSTSPAHIQAIDRGVYYGGNIALRNQLMTLQLVNFDAPYINAGCGGLDLYGGSLSFINKEQFTLLMKSVASNAVGYSFNLALTHVCPTCSQVVESLQQKIQALNQYLGNSCALAQGIVNDTVSALTNTKNNKISLLANMKGLGDTFSTFSSDKVSQKQQLTQDPIVKEKLYGNVVYKALQKAFGSKYPNEYYQEIMSLTGTVVSSPGTGKSNETDKVQVYAGDLMSLRGLITGSKLSRYTCVKGDCQEMKVTTVTREPLAKKLKSLYLGAAVDTEGNAALYGKGLIGIYETNQGSLTASQKKELLMVGEGINAQIRNLAIRSPDAARNYVNFAAEYIALKYAAREVEQAFRLVGVALQHVVEDDTLGMVKRLVEHNNLKYLQYIDTEMSKLNELQVLNYYNQLYSALDPLQGQLKGK